MTDQGQATPYEILEAQEVADVLELCLETLTEREEFVLRMRFWDCLTLREIGVRVGTGGSRARQIVERALRKLRHPMRMRPLEACLPSVLERSSWAPEGYPTAVFPHRFCVAMMEVTDNRRNS